MDPLTKVQVRRGGSGPWLVSCPKGGGGECIGKTTGQYQKPSEAVAGDLSLAQPAREVKKSCRAGSRAIAGSILLALHREKRGCDSSSLGTTRLLNRAMAHREGGARIS